jgi:hypothetical protein
LPESPTERERAYTGNEAHAWLTVRLSELLHNVGNLELLNAKENEGKSGQKFEKWITTRHDSLLARHLIPSDQKLWKLENFEKFVDAREGLIRQRLESLFGTQQGNMTASVIEG